MRYKIFLILLLSLLAVPAQAQSEPIVHGILFFRETCPHCHEFIQNDYPSYVEEFGTQFELLFVDIQTAQGQSAIRAAVDVYEIPRERQAVPMMILGDTVLVGTYEIEEQARPIIREALNNDGLAWPDIPGFDAMLFTPQWLVIENYSDLWLATEDAFSNPLALTNCGVEERIQSPPVPSPNGQYFAYLTRPTAVDTLINQTGGVGGALPDNVRLCDVNQEWLIGGQPEDFNLLDSNQPMNYDLPSRPAWSPDSQQLAWAVQGLTAETAHLVVYDVQTHTQHTIVTDLPVQFGVPHAPRVVWGNRAIVVENEAYDPSTGETNFQFLLYNADGAWLKSIDVVQDTERGYLLDFYFAYTIYDELLVLEYSNETLVLNLFTDEVLPLPGTLEMVAHGADDGLRLRYYPGTDTRWEVVTPDQNVVVLEYHDRRAAQSIAISPSGQSVAYAAEQVYVWRDGQLDTVGIPNPGEIDSSANLIWAAPVWRIVQ